MNKDIYSILNNTMNEDEEYESLSDVEVNNIMKRFNENSKTKTIGRRIKKFAVCSAAASACLAAFIVPKMAGSDEITNKNNTFNMTDSSTVQKNSFFLSVSAAEIEKDKAFSISTDNTGGEFPFSGSIFCISGTNIKNVAVSIDKGALYKTYEDQCEYIGREYSEKFVENICFGFYLSEEIYERYEAENPDGDLRKAWHTCLDEFDGAILNIYVDYNDGQTESISYMLKSGMLELDKGTMKPNGNLSDGNTPFIYGFYFEPKVK